MSLYKDVKELLDPIDLTLDMMKKFIQPAIFEGLKSNIEALKYLIKNQDERAKQVEEELEELKQDVKKFFEIKATHLTLGDEWDDYDYALLYQKLSKVGEMK